MPGCRAGGEEMLSSEKRWCHKNTTTLQNMYNIVLAMDTYVCGINKIAILSTRDLRPNKINSLCLGNFEKKNGLN